MQPGILLVTVAALLQRGDAGQVSIRMPYQSPAGVTYINNVDPHGLTYAVPAKVEAQHVGYAAAQVPAVAAYPFVKHVPTVSHVPVTKIEAQPVVLEKHLDVVKPAFSTRKFEVRRPGVQKQFYDIEERVVIRPAGSAVVELDQPTSKVQRGPAVIQPLYQQAITQGLYPQGIPQGLYPQAISQGFPQTIAQVFPQGFPQGISQEFPQGFPQGISPGFPQGFPQGISQGFPQGFPQGISQEFPQGFPQGIPQGFPQIGGSGLGFGFSTIAPPTASSTPSSSLNGESVVVENPDLRKSQDQDRVSNPQLRSSSRNASNEPFVAHDPTPGLIASRKSSPEEDRNNQKRLLELLTARGNVAEVGFARSGLPKNDLGDISSVRTRVLSATPAPDNAEPSDERVSTRRVVITSPIETLQEVSLVEPATKIERVSVQQPTLIKTARLDHVQVHGSVPVVGKALAPTLAHAAVPVYQKTISPAYEYYH